MTSLSSSNLPARSLSTWTSRIPRKKHKLVNSLIVANLAMRPVRTLVCIAAVGIEVVLIIIVVGLTHGMLEEVARRTQGIGADVLVQPRTSSVAITFGGAPMPIQITDKLAQVPNVKAVAPVVIEASSNGMITLIYGINDSFRAVTGGFRF